MPRPENELSLCVIALLKGVVYQESDATTWQSLLVVQSRVRDHVSILGLELVLDEAEGCAYLRQRAASEGEPELPRLVARRQLSYPVSLVLALLRKKLAEVDAGGGETRLILGRRDIADLVRVFLPDTANEARLLDRLDAHINKIVELGFLRRLRGQDDQLEVRRILKAYVDAQWLNEFERRLEDYRQHAAAEDREPPPAERLEPS
jgi:hypothetical protein